MADKNKDKGGGLLFPYSEDKPEDAPQEEKFFENISTVKCPYHDEDLEVRSENKEIQHVADGKLVKETIPVQYAVCECKVPDNPYRGRRVWERT